VSLPPRGDWRNCKAGAPDRIAVTEVTATAAAAAAQAATHFVMVTASGSTASMATPVNNAIALFTPYFAHADNGDWR
jgi:hypothetical protein